MRRQGYDEAMYQLEKSRRWTTVSLIASVVGLVALLFALLTMDHPEPRPSDTYDGISEGFDE